MKREIFLAFLVFAPLQAFCSQWVVCYENVEKEIAAITAKGGVIDEIKIFSINDHLKDESGTDDLKKMIIEKKLTAYRIKYRTAEEIDKEDNLIDKL